MHRRLLAAGVRMPSRGGGIACSCKTDDSLLPCRPLHPSAMVRASCCSWTGLLSSYLVQVGQQRPADWCTYTTTTEDILRMKEKALISPETDCRVRPQCHQNTVGAQASNSKLVVHTDALCTVYCDSLSGTARINAGALPIILPSRLAFCGARRPCPV